MIFVVLVALMLACFVAYIVYPLPAEPPCEEEEIEDV